MTSLILQEANRPLPIFHDAPETVTGDAGHAGSNTLAFKARLG